MYSTAQIIQLAIVALLGGIAIPLLVQVFLTARTVQRVSISLERKVDDTRKELHELLAPPRRESGGQELAALLASAAVPAVIAAVRAFRATTSGPPIDKAPSNGHGKEKTP
jgi:hypothetical protein